MDIVKKSQERCPFCPDKIFEKVPKFPEEIIKEGRFVIGETVLFPNMNPFGENHAVAVMANSHFLDVDGFKSDILKNTLSSALKYFEAIHRVQSQTKWPVLVWNFLPPSAGSIIHPHIQVLFEEQPLPELENRIIRSQNYFSQNKTNYYADLIAAEKMEKTRYLSGGDVEVFTSFAPRGFNEVSLIVPGVSSLMHLKEHHISALVASLGKLLLAFKSVGVGSFNLVSFSGSVDSTPESFWLNFKLFSRPFPSGVYTNDTGPMERMYDSWVIDSPPEILANNLRPFFA